MNEPEIKFLEESFKKYYFEHFSQIRTPERTSEREFGYQKFNSGMIRHMQVKDDKELHLLLMKNVPSDIYCSNACYSFPNLPMNEKDWKEADLIFDIDAKDLNLQCRENHTVSICNNCKEVSQNLKQCSICNTAKLEKKALPCKICINSSKTEVAKLTDILIGDLGIDRCNIHVYFSGNEGFHVHVNNSQFQQLGSRERSELVDYIMLNGIIPETMGINKFKLDNSQFPELNEKGWRGRFAKEAFGSKSRRLKEISKIIKNHNAFSSFQELLATVSKNIGVRIDPNVTMDIHRIFRLPGSINSKSSLTKIYCDDLPNFDPFADASFLTDDPIDVLVKCPVKFHLQNKKFGPFFNEKTTLPTFAAAYLICKKLATIA